ncbi:MAG: glycerol-3-phosphate 1-O-acyltransferase PlsY [Candidatus Krumholzibacteriia bacterium]|nr:glycerol-3-phosphate 1-O-acyltransferase PlsY [bacterium]MCB9515130.1 glycerol-3-phosphate 1-O-acyltransferase PlsY [Candidatus Latescibacterota bacterium]
MSAPLASVGLLLAAYLLGGISFSYLAGRMARGVDLRDVGSGNLGATNVVRHLGWGWGVGVFALDILKGWVAVALAQRLGPPSAAAWLPVAAGLAAILGHSFTPYLGFRGGKGVATSAGVFLRLAPAATGLALAVFLVVMLLGRIVSLASLAAATALPLLLLWRRPDEHVLLGFALLIAVLIWVRHRSNLRRLLRGQEPRLSASRKGGA